MSPQVVIKSKSEAEALLGVDRASKIKKMISIGSKGDSKIRGSDQVDEVLRLNFDDVVRNDYKNYDPPRSKDVRRIIVFARRLQDENYNGIFLIHCQAGKSRSTAAAYICNCVWKGVGKEKESLQDVYRRRAIASPNSLMIKIADHMLNRDGAMLEEFLKKRHAPGVRNPEYIDRVRGEI
jgi:predicted protein tyrosine phosphatase